MRDSPRSLLASGPRTEVVAGYRRGGRSVGERAAEGAHVDHEASSPFAPHSASLLALLSSHGGICGELAAQRRSIDTIPKRSQVRWRSVPPHQSATYLVAAAIVAGHPTAGLSEDRRGASMCTDRTFQSVDPGKDSARVRDRPPLARLVLASTGRRGSGQPALVSRLLSDGHALARSGIGGDGGPADLWIGGGGAYAVSQMGLQRKPFHQQTRC